MNPAIQASAQGLSDLSGRGTVSRVVEESMGPNERGWSGAAVLRGRVFFADGSSMPMIFKHTELKERRVMKLLTEQAQRTPAAYSADVVSDAPQWMAMQDLGPQKSPPPDDEPWLSSVAETLAAIHAANMGRGAEMPWLPPADDAYWLSVTGRLSVDHFAQKMEDCPAFSREFGRYLPRLRQEASRFARDMTALCQEGTSLTLTHGDLQMRDGAHIYPCGGIPYVIDFGFCRYAPFYIDLAGWFTPDSLPLYHRALTAQGIRLKYADCEERFRVACRYNGFIYLCPSVLDWRQGPTEQTGRRLMQALKIILDGDFPERKIHYSDALFAQLLREYHSPTGSAEGDK